MTFLGSAVKVIWGRWNLILTVLFFHKILDAAEEGADDSPKKLKLYPKAQCLVGFLGSTLRPFTCVIPLFSMNVDESHEVCLSNVPTMD